jgi:hypothetical protein
MWPELERHLTGFFESFVPHRYLFSTRLQGTEPADLASSSTVFSGRVWGKKKTPGELRSPLWLVDTHTLQQGTAANL